MNTNTRRQVDAALPLVGRRGEGETSPPGLQARPTNCGFCISPRPDCMGMLIPGIGNGCGALVALKTQQGG